jgi:hypothetical protein
MTKDQFYVASQQRDHEMNRRSGRWVKVLLLLVSLPSLFLFFDMPLVLRPHAQLVWAGYMIAVLITYIAITWPMEREIHNRYGMVCSKCKEVFAGSTLAHIGFVGSCKKCGQPAAFKSGDV